MKITDRFRVVAVIATLVGFNQANSFDRLTHAAMTSEVVAQSKVLGRDPNQSPLLKSLGLLDYDLAYGSRYVDIASTSWKRDGQAIEGAYVVATYNVMVAGPAVITSWCVKTKGMYTGPDGKFLSRSRSWMA